jgi:predicted CXXCH cytochrome family protein
VAILSVMHEPFQQNRCDACHTSQDAFQNISIPTDEACMSCHATVKEAWPFLHGPVAVNECLWCHDPHRSTVPSLLRHPAARLCRECHTQELLNPGVPEHLDLASDCLQCHMGHGGTDRYFLKPGARAPATEARVEPPAAPPAQPAEGQGAP